MKSRTILRTSLSLGVLASAALVSACGHAPAEIRVQAPPDPIAAEEAFLVKNAKSKNVISLPGLQYLVLQSGTGPHPTRSDDVTVRYEGRFINGQVFNSSPDNGHDTITFPLNKLIPGWVAALQMMRPGDVWMIYIPANLAYGEAGKQPVIPPYSTLVFRVELVSVAPHVDPPPPAPPPPPPPSPPPVVQTPIPPPPPPPPPAKPKPHHKPKPKPAEGSETDQPQQPQ
jgi:hypothetical protein